MAELPTGTVTLLFSDIEGSTRLLQRVGDAYADLLATHRALLLNAFGAHRGVVIDSEGDAFFVAFASAKDAALAAAAAQQALAAHDWPGGNEIRVRMGLHTGEPLVTQEGYVGIDVHRAARIASAGHGGQTLLSEVTHDLCRDHLPPLASVKALGSHGLKDLGRPESVFQLCYPDLPQSFQPLIERCN